MSEERMIQRGVVVITGAKGTGKTTAALTLARPSEIGLVYFDDAERGANRAVQEMERGGYRFGHYNDLESRFADRLPKEADLLSRLNQGDLPWATSAERSALEDYYDTVKENLDTYLVPGKFKYYIHDTLGLLESGMAAWVETRRGFGAGKAGWTTRSYGKMWTEGVYPLYRAFISAIMKRGVEVIILTSHLRTPWTEGANAVPMINKVEPMGKSILYQLSTLMLWLVKDGRNADGAPAALVLKERMGKLEVVDDRWVPRRMLPERIPHFAWHSGGQERDSVEWYLEHGCDPTNPHPSEVMSQGEREMISELMTSEQMKLMLALHEKGEPDGSIMVKRPDGDGPTVTNIINSVGGAPSAQVAKLMEKAVELGLNEENREEIEQKLVADFPIPLQSSGVAREKSLEAIDRVLNGAG